MYFGDLVLTQPRDKEAKLQEVSAEARLPGKFKAETACKHYATGVGEMGQSDSQESAHRKR